MEPNGAHACAESSTGGSNRAAAMRVRPYLSKSDGNAAGAGAAARRRGGGAMNERAAMQGVQGGE